MLNAQAGANRMRWFEGAKPAATSRCPESAIRAAVELSVLQVPSQPPRRRRSGDLLSPSVPATSDLFAETAADARPPKDPVQRQAEAWPPRLG